METRDILFMITVIFIVVILLPQAWKEDNSFWFAPIKFWFGIFPFMCAAIGIFCVFVGPIYALVGLFYWEFSPITILYLYVFGGFYLIAYINNKYDNILDRL